MFPFTFFDNMVGVLNGQKFVLSLTCFVLVSTVWSSRKNVLSVPGLQTLQKEQSSLGSLGGTPDSVAAFGPMAKASSLQRLFPERFSHVSGT